MAKGDWLYIKSGSLNQTVAFDKNSGWLFCEDGTRYSPEELKKMQDATKGAELPLSVHLVKKVLGGEITNVGEKGTSVR